MRIEGLGGLSEGDPEAESEAVGSPTFLRGAMWVVTVIVAMVMTAIRACQGT